MLTPSNRFLKVSSKIEISEDLQFQKEYTITLTGTMVKKEIGDEQNGESTVTFKFKPTEISVN